AERVDDGEDEEGRERRGVEEELGARDQEPRQVQARDRYDDEPRRPIVLVPPGVRDVRDREEAAPEDRRVPLRVDHLADPVGGERAVVVRGPGQHDPLPRRSEVRVPGLPLIVHRLQVGVEPGGLALHLGPPLEIPPEVQEPGDVTRYVHDAWREEQGEDEPDHFVAIAAPPAAPAAKRYGLHNGAGSRRFGLAAASPPPAGEVSMAGGGVRRSIHRRSSKRKTKTSTTQNATKMSSVPVRDWTRFNPSVANRRPPVNVHNGLAHNNWMMTASSITVAVP